MSGGIPMGAGDAPGQMAVRTGRAPLTERRKAETRLEIARAAVSLFTANGVLATPAEQIAELAGISVRTLWRYCPTKEACVLPLLTPGIEMAAHALRTWPAGGTMSDLIDELDHLDHDGVETEADAPTLLSLVRLTHREPRLRAVWLQAHHEAEPVFAGALAERAGLPSHDLTIKVQAAMLNSAIRTAVEHYALESDAADADRAGLLTALRTALSTVGRGLAQTISVPQP